MAIFILPQDIRHGDHLHCASGIRRFCQRTGIDFDRLMRGEVTADELKSTGQYMGMEAARNAEERAAADGASQCNDSLGDNAAVEPTE